LPPVCEAAVVLPAERVTCEPEPEVDSPTTRDNAPAAAEPVALPV